MFKKIVCFILLSVMVFALASCDNTPDSEEFISIMSGKGFDIDSEMENEPGYGTIYCVEAYRDDIEFYFLTFESDELAEKYFQRIKLNIADEMDPYGDVESSSDYYSVTDGGEFAAVGVSGDTVLCCEAEGGTKGTAERIIKELGYGK